MSPPTRRRRGKVAPDAASNTSPITKLEARILAGCDARQVAEVVAAQVQELLRRGAELGVEEVGRVCVDLGDELILVGHLTMTHRPTLLGLT